MEAQSQICGSRDRNRLNKNRNTVHVLSNKRSRKSGSFDENPNSSAKKNDEQKHGNVLSEEEVKSDLDKPQIHPRDSSQVENLSESEEPRTGSVLNSSMEEVVICSKKVPLKLKDLLASGVLDGRPVNYVQGMKAKKHGIKGLPGVIKGNGIVCSCTKCNGVNVVGATMFEHHAGSTNKRPTENIQLQNGSTLRDVINALSNAPLATFEKAVQNVFAGLTVQKSTFCFNCRDVNVVSSSGLLCNSCIGFMNGQPSLTQITENSVSLAVQSRSHGKNQPKQTKREHQRMHKSVFKDGLLSEGAELSYCVKRQKLLTGRKEGNGIRCNCCDSVVSPSVFEAHAGCASRRNPYLQIFTSDNISLHNLSTKDHVRSIRVVKINEGDHAGCALCSGHDFSTDCFGPETVIICDQCEKEYHVKCLKDHKMQNLEELPKGNWFCCSYCENTHTALLNLVACGEVNIPDSVLSLIKQKHEEKGNESEFGLDIKWRILRWSLADQEDDETKSLFSKVVDIFHEQFDPIVDPTTGFDFIPNMLYGEKTQDHDFCGMYCAVLIVNQVVVSAAVFRVFGQDMAELPLVATNSDSQGQGYFGSLLSCIERVLGTLNVKDFVLPAAKKAESIWIDKFGFTSLDKDKVNNYKSYYKMMEFNGTTFLHKLVPAGL